MLPESIDLDNLVEIWQEGDFQISASAKHCLRYELLSRHEKHEELLGVSSGLLANVPKGIGPRRPFNRRLGAGLGRLARQLKPCPDLPGMGSKRKARLFNIEMRENQGGRVLLASARELASEICGYLKGIPGVKRVETGGSLRRWRETVGDIDLVAAGDDPPLILEGAACYPRFRQMLESSPGRAKFLTDWGIVVIWRWCRRKSSISRFSKYRSKAHYRRLQQLFTERGLALEEAGITAAVPLSGNRIFTLRWFTLDSSELREDRGEVEAALGNCLPSLLETDDLKGDLHIHTNWSDGINSMEQMVQRARAKGYQYIAVTDHSRSLKIARGLSLEKLREQHEKIRKMNDNLTDFRILTGIEVDILPGGGLDCPDEILEKIDVVVASVHSAFKQDRETMTRRILSAVENKNVDIIGHLTGRLILQREGYNLDFERVLEAAAGCGTILEINASPDRLDLNDLNARKAKEKGIKIAINTDAHELKRMDEMPYGVSVARRAWLGPGDVINTMPVEELMKFLQNR